jgi:hypothetical protein
VRIRQGVPSKEIECAAPIAFLSQAGRKVDLPFFADSAMVLVDPVAHPLHVAPADEGALEEAGPPAGAAGLVLGAEPEVGAPPSEEADRARSRPG